MRARSRPLRVLHSVCRCSDCDKIPDSCQWGGGPYAGTLLLYLQEVAVNMILTQAEWDSSPLGLLDHGVTDKNKERDRFIHLLTRIPPCFLDRSSLSLRQIK